MKNPGAYTEEEIRAKDRVSCLDRGRQEKEERDRNKGRGPPGLTLMARQKGKAKGVGAYSGGIGREDGGGRGRVS